LSAKRWETVQDGATDIAPHTSKSLRKLFNRAEQGIESCEEFFTKTRALLFVPPICIGHILANASTKNQSHQLTASSQGKHFRSSDDVIWRDFMLRKAFVDHRTMSVAKGNVDQLDQPQAFFGGESEYFCNVGGAHQGQRSIVASRRWSFPAST
jgi:hypothetical protein